MDVQIGKITHYFDKIGVAVVEVTKPLKVGETVRISGHDKEFKQVVSSLQVEHKPVTKVGKGDSAGMLVVKPVKEGDRIFRVKLIKAK